MKVHDLYTYAINSPRNTARNQLKGINARQKVSNAEKENEVHN